MTGIKRERERIVYQNDFVTAYDDEVQWPSGRRGTYFRLAPRAEGPGVVIVAEWEGKLGLVKTYRYAIAAEQWAFPRGFSQGEDPLQTAASELMEELGATATSLGVLGHLTPDSGLQSSRVAVVHGHVSKVSTPTDHDEVLDTCWLRIDEIEAQVRAGAIDDGFTLAALSLLRLK